jgi:hypothetical protein
MPRAWHALAAYTVIALVATWPLACGLGRDVPWDLGDSVMVMWALAWDCEQLLGVLRGDVGRLATFFDANIFHPAPLTLAYSEHFLPQALQVLPIYATTGNPILCYNLLFLSTFVLSGLGMYLFVRELTGDARAAFMAGLLFAFAPYRIPQSGHLHVLSSQWMPFALYGFRRYFDTRQRRPLAGAALALAVQNLSCGYYLLYFSPFAAAYVAWEIVRRRAWHSWRTWAELIAAALVVLALTLPFLLPYAALREQLQLGRAPGEVIRYSADVFSYGTASAVQPVWGAVMRAFPKPEGDLFPGVVTLLLALAGILVPCAANSRHTLRSQPPSPQRLALVLLVGAAIAVHLAAAAAALLYRRVVLDLGLFDLRISNINQPLLRAVILIAVLLYISPAIRARAGAFWRERGFFLGGLVAAMWLSLGLTPQALGRPIELVSPYAVLYEYVPGFDGVRVPARFAMIAVLMLSVLGGFGAAALRHWRWQAALLTVLAGAFLAESLVLPFTVNGASPPPGYNAPESRLYRPARGPNIYLEVARQAPDGVLAELPIGEPDFDLRAMYYSIVHWRPLLNGYSGFHPPHYPPLALALSDIPRHTDVALAALGGAGATHVIVHEGAYLGGQGPDTTAALQRHGALELYRDRGDVLLRLPDPGTGVAVQPP